MILTKMKKSFLYRTPLFSVLMFMLVGFFPICFPWQTFGFSFFYRDKTSEKPKLEKDRDGLKYKTLSGDLSIKVLDLKTYHSPRELNPLSKLKWYQNRRKWGECLKIVESLSEDHSLGVWLAFSHLTCMTNWYRTTRGLKVRFILNSFEKLETRKNLLLNSNFQEHRKKFIKSFLNVCELTLKHLSNRFHSLVKRNRDLIGFMDQDQRRKYQNLLSRASHKLSTEDIEALAIKFYEKPGSDEGKEDKEDKEDKKVQGEQKKQVKKTPSISETRLWIQFSGAFRKKQRLKMVRHATDFLNQFPESGKTSHVREKTYKIYKNLFRRSGKRWKSLTKSFEELLLKAPVEDVLFWANKSYSQGYYDISLGLTEKAINQGVINQQADRDKTPEFLLLAGRSAYNQSDFQKAMTYFQTLIEKHREHKSSHEARYLLGLLYYRQGNHEKVISIYDPFLKNSDSDPWELQIRYWFWRSLKKTNSTKAIEIAEVILKKFPLTYYGLIVRQHEKNSLQNLISSETESLDSIFWETRGTEKQWERIKKLMELGWTHEAQMEIDLLPEPQQASGFVVRSLLWHELSLFNRFTKDYASAIDKDHRYISANLLKTAFPKKYEELVVRAEEEFSISSYLIWSIIRQESAFTPQAVSPSRAYGLMQLLGPTARETARWLRVRGFNKSRDVFKPKYNIRFGTHYFLRMSRKYKRMPPLAIASYNVGPGNLDRWLRYRSDLKDWDKTVESLDNDLWMDELPWSETSFYVKAVLRNYLLYGIIHNKNDRLPQPPWLDIKTTVSKKNNKTQ